MIALITALVAPSSPAVAEEDKPSPKIPDVVEGGSDFDAVVAAGELAPDKPSPVDIGARVVTPAAGGRGAVAGGAFYVQFAEALSGHDRAVMAQVGISFGQAVAGSTYLVRVPAGGVRSIVEHPDFLGLAAVLPSDGLSPALRSGTVHRDAIIRPGVVAGTVEFFPDVSLEDALSAADAAGVVVPDRSRFLFGNRLDIEGTFAEFGTLAAFSGVMYLSEQAPPGTVTNLDAQGISNVDDVQTGGLNGAGVKLGMWDGGPVRASHQDLTLARVNISDAGTTSDHATHVAGTMIGDGAAGAGGGDANAEGMAPGVPTLQSYDFYGDVPDEMVTAATTQEIVASNHSWGYVAGRNRLCPAGWCGEEKFGEYEAHARAWDEVVRSTGLIIVKSAGNDRNDCGAQAGDVDNCDGTLAADGEYYDNIAFMGTAKNVVTIGAIGDDGTTITSFSSSGPADDGRIKPDVVANGVGLLSTCSTSDTEYCEMSGDVDVRAGRHRRCRTSGGAVIASLHAGADLPGRHCQGGVDQHSGRPGAEWA